MKVLCVTHSSRPFLEARCTINAFERRFSPDRLRCLPELESLGGVEQAVPYHGSLTLWQVNESGEAPELRFLRHYRPPYKVQFATFHGSRLLVYGADRLEVLDPHWRVEAVFRDPWLVGGHTVHVDESGIAWLTCAPANAVLGVDLERRRVVERLEMPERYGRGYRLSPEDDLRQHYIPTDLQPTHVNSAVPWRGGLLVTLLIPGAVGFFDSRRRYREIVSGFRGCHGARVSSAGDGIYFTDSPSGMVWFVDPERRRLRGRIGTGSRWLHDAAELGGGWLVCALGDRNELWLIDRHQGKVHRRIGCSRFGGSVMFTNCCRVGPEWSWLEEESGTAAAPPPPPPRYGRGRELLSPVLAHQFWSTVPGQEVQVALKLGTREAKSYEYMLTSRELKLKPGRYLLRAKIDCGEGGLSVGVLEVERDRWLVQLRFDEVKQEDWRELELKWAARCRVVVAAFNPERAMPIEGLVRDISLVELA